MVRPSASTRIARRRSLGARSQPRAEDEPRPRVLDLYGGSGAIALALAHAGADVHLVESFAPVGRPRRSRGARPGPARTRRGRRRRRRRCAGSTSRRARVRRGGREPAAPRNEPRSHASWSRASTCRALAYVSCDPDTLARDLDHFSRLGFTVATLRPLDMIPLTDEVETVAVLRRIAVPAPRVALRGRRDPHRRQGRRTSRRSPQAEYASRSLSACASMPGRERSRCPSTGSTSARAGS